MIGHLLCFFGFHRLERRSRFIYACTKPGCAAYVISDAVGERSYYWRWDWLVFKKQPHPHATRSK